MMVDTRSVRGEHEGVGAVATAAHDASLLGATTTGATTSTTSSSTAAAAAAAQPARQQNANGSEGDVHTNHGGLPAAAQPDIIRASMKDDFYRQLLYSSALDLALRSLGPQWAQTHKAAMKVACDLTYFSLTTLRGMQTLGEEYCDLVQVASSPGLGGGAQPQLVRRVVLMCTAILIPYLYRQISAKLLVMSRPRLALPQPSYRIRQRVGQLDEDLVFSPITSVVGWFKELKYKLDAYRFDEPTSQFLQINIPRLKQAIKFYKRFHLGLFYLFGVYYHISKRAAGIEYVFNRKVNEARLQYHVLGLMIFAQLGIQSILWLSEQASRTAAHDEEAMREGGAVAAADEEQRQRVTAESDADSETPACMLCMEPRKFATATPCGHLYCWYCIHDALKVKPECPMCRQGVSPNALTRLYNYK